MNASVGPNCVEGISRREVLRRGLCGAAGMMLGEGLTSGAMAAAAAPEPPKAKSVIQIFLWGGMSHNDTWDPKPESGYEYMGEFTKVVPTNVPGIQVSEYLPRLARQADKYAIVRSVHTDNHNHSTSEYAMFSGFLVPNVGENNSAPDPKDHPALGSTLVVR